MGTVLHKTGYQIICTTLRRPALRQVSSHCVDRGRVIEKVGARYRELFQAAHAVASAVGHTNSVLIDELARADQRAADQDAELEAARAAARAAEARAAEAEEARRQVEVRLERLQWDLDTTTAALTEQNEVGSWRLVVDDWQLVDGGCLQGGAVTLVCL